MQGIIHLNDIKKDYYLGKQVIEVLKGITFDILKNEYVALMGPSGSGKSTLMNILGCLDRPDSGEYYLAGLNVANQPESELAKIRNQRIGFVFQTFNLLPRMSALENVGLPLLYAGIQQPQPRAQEALRTVGLAERMHHEPNQLSGGQRQRVAIARAIVANPAIILADEPTGNLDSKTSEEIMKLFLDLNRQGRTVIIVTHEPDIAAYCQRQIHMKDGRIVEMTGAA